MNIIGINGFKRSGKGETGEAIARNYPGTVKQVGFADALKVLGMQSLGFDRSRDDLIALADSVKVDTEIKMEYAESPDYGGGKFLHDTTGRSYLQQLGTRGREVLGDTVWIDIVLPRPSVLNDIPSDLRARAEELANESHLTARYPDVDCVAITDLRFENEAERVLALGGEVWEVIRPETNSDGHASEQVLPRELVTRQVQNSADLNSLDHEVQRALYAAGMVAA